jgi:DNA-binding response OmpR family regulator
MPTTSTPSADRDVLVVDDSPEICDLLRAYLAQSGYRSTGAANGEEAISAVRRSAPDLMLLDLHMPGVDGWEVIREVRRLDGGRALPIIVMTASRDEAHLARARALGADCVLSKDVQATELVERIRAALKD